MLSTLSVKMGGLQLERMYNDFQELAGVEFSIFLIVNFLEELISQLYEKGALI